MNDQQLQKLRADAKKRYTDTKRHCAAMMRQAKSEYAADLEAVERIHRMAGSVISLSTEDGKKMRKTRQKHYGRGSLTEAVKDAVKLAPEVFTASDIMGIIDERHPGLTDSVHDATLTSTVKRLAGLGFGFDLHQPGRGKRPAKYIRSKRGQHTMSLAS